MSRMNAWPPAIAIAALVCVAQCPANADPASSPQTAWTDTPFQRDPALTDPAVVRGKDVFQARCGACHSPIAKRTMPPTGLLDGLPSMAGTAALEAKYKGSKPAALEQRDDLTPEFVAFYVRHGAGIMPPFRPTEVSKDDLGALGAYLSRNRR